MKLYTAFPFAILGAFFLALQKHLENIRYDGFWLLASGYLATALLAIAAAVALGWAWESLPRIIRAIGDVGERWMHPQVAEMHYASMMSAQQLDYLASMQNEVVITPLKVFWRAGGVEMPEAWIISHLSRCNRYYPELPPIRKQGSGSTEQLREQAFIDFGVQRGWIVKREGQTAIWIRSWSPDKVLKEVLDD